MQSAFFSPAPPHAQRLRLVDRRTHRTTLPLRHRARALAQQRIS
jgi:hypothetical protein